MGIAYTNIQDGIFAILYVRTPSNYRERGRKGEGREMGGGEDAIGTTFDFVFFGHMQKMALTWWTSVP